MISIRDIAKECGVSVATVSKALNGHHDISAQTRETVCRKAAEMGYQPNSAARALKTNRTYNLGVLYEDPQHSGLGHEYFSRILESFRAQAEACGYDVAMIEFTSLEHTARNIMIKAVKTNAAGPYAKKKCEAAEQQYQALCDFYQVTPTIGKLGG